MTIFKIQFLEYGVWKFYDKQSDSLSETRKLWLHFITERSKYRDYQAARIVKCKKTRQGEWLIREVVEYQQLKEEEF